MAIELASTLICGVSNYDDSGNLHKQANIPIACRNNYLIYIDWSGFSGSRTGMSLVESRRAFDRGAEAWEKLIDINLRYTDIRSEAHCVISWRSLTGNILAWSNLANGSCRQGQQQAYDNDRRFSAHLLYLTVAHELGHLLGLLHEAGTLMNTGILTQLQGPTARDVAQAVRLGYDRRDSEPEPDPPDSGELRGTIEVDGATYQILGFRS